MRFLQNLLAIIAVLVAGGILTVIAIGVGAIIWRLTGSPLWTLIGPALISIFLGAAVITIFDLD
jgi:hypothetical protein